MSIKDEFSVLPIKPRETYDWLLNKHYAKRIPSISFSFGLYDSNRDTVGVLTIGKPASHSLCIGICGENNSKFVYELNRLITDDNLPKNTLSYFLSSSLKMLPDIILVSYADKLFNHHGYIYQATNWIYTGATKERTDIGFDDGSHSRHYDKRIDTKINRKKRSSKHRYVYFVAGGSKKKKWLSELRYKSLEYPKGNNINYDASYETITQRPLFL